MTPKASKKPTNSAKQGAVGRAVVDAVQVATPCKIALNNLHDIRREMARVYRESRSGKIDMSDASKLNYQLQGLVKVIEASVIEDRLLALENGSSDDALENVQDVEYVEVANG